MPVLEVLRHHLGVNDIADLSSPSTLVALGLTLSVGYAATRYLTKQAPVQPIAMAPGEPPVVVILGGGYAGTALAHKLLRDLVPKIRNLKVVLVSKSSHLYWNFASVRAIVPGEIPDESLFLPVAPAFAKYHAERFEFVVGNVTSVDVPGNAVQVETLSGPRRLAYHHLVVATGTRLAADHLPFKDLENYEETVTALHQLQQEVDQADSIVIAGAGATGVETAGELGCKYGVEKQITLVVDGDYALPALMPSAGKSAERDLKSMGVKLVHNARVNAVEDVSEGGKKLTLSNGTTLTADLYLPLFGLRPNSEFLPPHMLDEKGHVKVEPTLRVPGQDNVWAAGDVTDVETKQVMKAAAQAQHVYANLDAVLTGSAAGLGDYKASARPLLFVTLGKKKGTGQMGGFKPFSFLVAYVKGRTLFTEKAPAVLAGKGF